MVQDMVERIRDAEREGEEMERTAAARANARLARADEEIAALRRETAGAVAKLRSDARQKAETLCEDLRQQAEREAADRSAALSAQAEKNRRAAVTAAVELFSE